jgi:iron complex transport system substrate-binding protein
VSLVPAVTEILFAVGAGSSVVGVSSFDQYPPEVRQRTRVGALIDPDLERILRLRPDLVVLYASQEDLRRQLARSGIPMFEYRHGTLAQVPESIRAVARRAGRGPDGDRVAAAVEARIAAVRARVAGRPRPRVLLVFGREPGTLRNIQASGGYGFLHDMLLAAGGDNVFADVPRESVQATTELILARRPEVVIELQSPGLSSVIEGDTAWNALASVPAVRAKRVTVMVGDQFVVPGPRVADAIEALARVLHPGPSPR